MQSVLCESVFGFKSGFKAFLAGFRPQKGGSGFGFKKKGVDSDSGIKLQVLLQVSPLKFSPAKYSPARTSPVKSSPVKTTSSSPNKFVPSPNKPVVSTMTVKLGNRSTSPAKPVNQSSRPADSDAEEPTRYQ